MRAVIYARYSSENQRDASIQDQIEVCRRLIEQQNWTLIDTYTDHAISGASKFRPAYQKLLEDARAAAFDVVVAEALDRLSRDQEDVAALYKQLAFHGIRIVTLAEGEIAELHIGLKGTMNALYLKDLAQKTWRGLEGRVRQGRSGGGKAYGYDVVKEIDAGGQPVHGGRQTNEAEAAIVRRIFEEFAAGHSPRAIARRLNAEGIPGPGDRPWSDTTIRGHAMRRTGILHNDLYVGRLIWNKQRYVKDPQTGRRLARLNPEHEWVIQEVPHLRIVDQELWERVQTRLGAIRDSPAVRQARAKQFWLDRRPKHLLTGLVRCGVCGTTFTAVGRHYLACGAARRQGTCGNRRGLPRGVLEDLILDALKRNLMQADLVKEFIAAFHAETNERRRSREVELALKRRELEQVSAKHEGLISAIADGLRTEGLLATLHELERRKAELIAELAAAPPPAPHLHPNLAELYRRKVNDLHQALTDSTTRTEAVEILRGLVEAIRLYPIEGGFEIELVGDIANMIKLPGKGSSVPDEYRSSVKVVAGARNHRELTVPAVLV
jgi:DNA invertase Pin-like site-specific DNA recombinase